MLGPVLPILRAVRPTVPGHWSPSLRPSTCSITPKPLPPATRDGLRTPAGPGRLAATASPRTGQSPGRLENLSDDGVLHRWRTSQAGQYTTLIDEIHLGHSLQAVIVSRQRSEKVDNGAPVPNVFGWHRQ